MTVDENLVREALALLRVRGYICITAEEAEKVRGALRFYANGGFRVDHGEHGPTAWMDPDPAFAALALLGGKPE